MPTLNASQLGWLRSTNQRTKLYLSILQPTQIIAAVLSTYEPGARQYLFHYFAGIENVRAGQTIKVGRFAGDDSLGRVRIKGITGPDGNGYYHVDVSENSVHVVLGTYVTIYDDYELWPVYPRVEANGDLEIWQDYDIEYSDQNTNQDPIPIMGSSVAKAVDATHPTAQVYFDWSDSYCPDGSSISSYSAIFEGGTPSTSTAATPGYVSYTVAGSYWVHLTVTASNGKSFTGHRRVKIHSPSDVPIVNFELTSLSGSWDAGGWTANIRVHSIPSPATPFPLASSYPDRAYIIIWREDWGDGVQRSIGRIADREHVLFTGYLDGESVRRAPNRKYVEFTALGIVPFMQKLRCWPVTLQHSDAPERWIELDTPTPYTASRFFLRWNTTALSLADFYPKANKAAQDAGATGRLFSGAKYLDFEQENVTETIDKLLEGTVFGYFASDQYGRMFCEVNTQMHTGTITYTMDMTDGDWRDEEAIAHPHRTACSWCELSGVYWDGSDEDPVPVISQAPGNAPLEEGSDQVVQNLLTPPQSELNALAGLYLSWKNNRFPEVNIPMAGNWTNAFDIIPQESIRISFNGTETARGYVWVNQQCIIRGVEHRYDYKTGNILTDLTCEVRTSGPPGVAGNYPDIPPPPPPCDDCPPPCVPCTPCDPAYPCQPPPTNTWHRKVYIATRTKGIYHTHNFTGPGGGATAVGKYQ